MAIKQLEMVARLERDKEDKLGREFQKAQQHLTQNEQKLDGIEEYRMDYVRQLQGKSDAGININSYSHYQQFISKLEEALEQQNQIIDTARQVVGQRKILWLEQQRKRKAVEMLVNKHYEQQLKKENKAEQALLDEVATQRFFKLQREAQAKKKKGVLVY
ncbi:MAG: flagellar FliJ protein [Phenylobacterium sp.]|jgi:flagellar FliJ protein